jgi:hypothetical protein
MLQLIFDFGGAGHSLRDFLAEQFAVTPAHPMHGLRT